MTGAGTSDQQWHACCARWVMRPSVAAIRPSRPDSPPPAPPAMAMNPEKSSPAEKARPSPDNTTARTEVSAASRAPASTRATNMSASSALSLSGRLSRPAATPPAVATVTRSVIAASRSPAHSAPRRAWDRAGLADRIELRIAPALDTLRSLPAEPHIDLAFIDADKGGYVGYWDELVPRVRPGGLLLADNVLWSGRVVESPRTAEANEPDDNTRAIRAFNDHVAADDRVDAAVLPAFDGLTIARRR